MQYAEISHQLIDATFADYQIIYRYSMTRW